MITATVMGMATTIMDTGTAVTVTRPEGQARLMRDGERAAGV